MKIVRHPYQANIVPQSSREDALWYCVVRRDGSAEILAQHDTANKEDARCMALLEISRLRRGVANPGLREAS